MAEITAALVKDLREKTGAGMMDCKNALTAAGGEVEAAIDWLRKKGLAAAAKKSGRVAAEGLVGVASKPHEAAVVEIDHDEWKLRGGEFVGQDLPDPPVAADDGVVVDDIHLLAFSEFSNGFHNFSFSDKSDDFADYEDHGARARDDNEHGENFSGGVKGMHLAISNAKHGDDNHVN